MNKTIGLLLSVNYMICYIKYYSSMAARWHGLIQQTQNPNGTATY